MKYIKFLIFAVTGTMFVSCDTDEFLNPLPDSVIVCKHFFSNGFRCFGSGIVGIYDAIQGVNENTESNSTRFNRGVQLEYLLTEHRSDNTRSKTLEGLKS